MPVESSVRVRRRAETVAEIKTAALAQLAEIGAGALSLRAVARAVGMTVQSIYHYFDGRDALLAALVTDAHHDLADAVQAAADAGRGAPALDRRLAACVAYREWAHANRAAFLLIYGTPVPGFAAEPESGAAAWRLAAPFADVVFDGWTPAELAAIAVPSGAESIPDLEVPELPLPAGALAYFVELRARMHGLVVLELLGHLGPLRDHGHALFVAGMTRMSDEIDARRAQESLASR